MTVYFEYVLIDNFVIDYLLLKTTFEIVGKTFSKKRLIFCSLLGAILSLIFPLISIEMIKIPLKICCGLFLTLISNAYNSKKEYYVVTVIFFALTFALGGAIIGVYQIFNIDYSHEISIALMFLPVYILLKGIVVVVKFLYRRKDVMRLVCKISLRLGEVEIEGKGFLDTGNGVFYNDRPVIFCGKSLAKKFFKGSNLPKMQTITVNTVNGQSKNIAFTLDEFKVWEGDEPNIYSNVMLCVLSEANWSGYEVILHPALMEVKNGQTACDVNTKVG